MQTSLREWAYARSYANSEQRASAFFPWLHHYNWHRPHASLGYNPPISRIPLNNVAGFTQPELPKTPLILAEFKRLSRDQGWFLAVFTVKIALRLLVFAYKPWLGVLFLAAYAAYF